MIYASIVGANLRLYGVTSTHESDSLAPYICVQHWTLPPSKLPYPSETLLLDQEDVLNGTNGTIHLAFGVVNSLPTATKS